MRVSDIPRPERRIELAPGVHLVFSWNRHAVTVLAAREMGELAQANDMDGMARMLCLYEPRIEGVEVSGVPGRDLLTEDDGTFLECSVERMTRPPFSVDLMTAMMSAMQRAEVDDPNSLAPSGTGTPEAAAISPTGTSTSS